MVELVDTLDLKSNGRTGCAGSSPAPGTKRDKRSISTSCFFGTSQDLTNPEDELDWFREDRSCNFLLSVEAFLSAVCFPGEGPKAEAKEDLSPK